MKRSADQQARQHRRVIFNNDGDDAMYHAQGDTPEDLLAVRAVPVTGTGVTTMFYCMNGPIGLFQNNTNIGKVLMDDLTPDTRNITRALVAAGTDPLEIMVAYCREHGIEIFSTVRMNDVHDCGKYEVSKMLFPPFKEQHPQYLHGASDRQPKYGWWSGVNYAEDEVRDYVFRIVEDYCTRYDIDGVELDFLRHPPFFTPQAWGTPATDEERAQMTDLVRRTRMMTRDIERARDRPFPLAARLIETPALSYDYGLDIYAWLREGLLDWVTLGELSKAAWPEWVRLCHAYNVAFYPGLLRSIGPKDGQIESLRAQAMIADYLGADGIYLFNLYPEAGNRLQTSREVFEDLGKPSRIRFRDKLFDFRRSDGWHGYYPTPDRYLGLPAITQDEPLEIVPGRPTRLPLLVSDRLDVRGHVPTVTVEARATGRKALAALDIALNDVPCINRRDSAGGCIANGQPGSLRRGDNLVTIETHRAGVQLTDLFVRLTYPDAGLQARTASR